MLNEVDINQDLLKEKKQALQAANKKLAAFEKSRKLKIVNLEKQKQAIDDQLIFLTATLNRITSDKQDTVVRLNHLITEQKSEMLADEFILVDDALDAKPRDDNRASLLLSGLMAELENVNTSLRDEQEGFAQECAEIETLRAKHIKNERLILDDYDEKIDSLEAIIEGLNNEIELLYQQSQNSSAGKSASQVLQAFAESEVLPLAFADDTIVSRGAHIDENIPLIAKSPKMHYMVASYLRHLDLDIAKLLAVGSSQPKPQLSSAGLHEGLQHILKAETSRLSYLRWANIENLLIKSMQGSVSSLDMIPSGVSLDDFPNKRTIFPGGRAIPVERNATRRRQLMTSAVVEGTEHALMSLLHMTLYSVLVFQLYSLQGQFTLDGLKHIFKSYEEVGTNSIVRLLAKMRPEVTAGVLISFMVTSVFILAARQVIPVWQANNKKADVLIDQLDKLSFDIVKNNASFLFPYRWLPPFSLLPYFNFESYFTQAEHYILHQGDISPEKRLEIWTKVKELALKQNKLVRREAMHTIANIAHGIALKDLVWLHDQGYTSQELSVHLYIKADAYGVLHYLAGRYQLDSKTGPLNHYVYPFSRYLYANYLLWWLNDTNRLLKHPRLSVLASLLFLVFKVGKLVLQAKLFEIIIKSIIEAIRCPDLPYVQFGKEIPVYANKLTIQCFEQLVKYFRSVPGNEQEPVSLITDNLQHFDFWLRDEAGNTVAPGLTHLDLSYKFLHASEVAQLLVALKNHASKSQSLPGNGIDLRALNLSSQGNDLAQASFGSNVSMYCLLNPSRCDFFSNMNSLVKILVAWHNLEVFDFSNNDVDALNVSASHNMKSLAIGLGRLRNLKFLSLAGNGFGDWVTDSDGCFVGKMLAQLTVLEKLDLSDNRFGLQTVKAIGDSFTRLTKLQNLDLDKNQLESANTNGLWTFISNLRYLISLKKLSMRRNNIGALGTESMVRFAESLSFLRNLTDIDVSMNRIGYTGTAGLLNIANALKDLKRLQAFNIANNYYFAYLNVSDIHRFALSTRNLSFIPNFSENVANDTQLNHLINYMTPSQLLRVYVLDTITSPATMSRYLMRLPKESETLTPYYTEGVGGLCIANNETLEVFSYYLPKFSNLKVLALYRLVGEDEGYYFNNTIFSMFSRSMGSLKNLTTLSIRDMSGTNFTLSTVVLAKNLVNLRQLQSLILIAPYGRGSADGIRALGSSLHLLNKLITLGLGLCQEKQFLGDCGECPGNVGFSELTNNIQYATKLKNLLLPGNCLDYNSTTGSIMLAKSLQKLMNLQVLQLADNHIGYTGTDGIEALGNSLASLIILENLIFQGNDIGYLSTKGLLAIANGVSKLNKLQYLSLVDTQIGLHGLDGLRALSDAMIRSRSNARIDIWDNPADDLTSNFTFDAQRKYFQLNQSCNDQICHANDLYSAKQQPAAPSPGTRAQPFFALPGNVLSNDGVLDMHASQGPQQYLLAGLYLYSLLRQSNLDSPTAFRMVTLFTAMQYLNCTVSSSLLITSMFISAFNAMKWATDDVSCQKQSSVTAKPISQRQLKPNDSGLSKYGLFRQNSSKGADGPVRVEQKTHHAMLANINDASSLLSTAHTVSPAIFAQRQ